MSKTPRTRRIIQLSLAGAIVSSMTGSVFALGDANRSATPRSAAMAGSQFAIASTGSVEAAAVGLAERAREIPVRDGDLEDVSRYCDPENLRVVWEKPEGVYRFGAYIEPLGPAPGSATRKVNGIVVCDGSTYAYMGFEAVRTLTGWEVIPVPVIDGGEHPNLPENPADDVDTGLVPHATLPAKPASKPAKKPAGVVKPAASLTAAIETYSGYEAQSTCSPTAKPGVLALKKLVLAANPGTRSLGISRGCSVGGRSEHKEGRAWDWGAHVNRPAERAAADKLIKWLFATDEYGNTHAMARRLGIMYIVYNRKIWGAYRAEEGWRSYNGASPHTDHVHFSFAWPGAQGKTSFWTGKPTAMPGGNAGGGGGGGGGGNLIDWRGRNGDKQRDERGGEDKIDGRPDWRDNIDGRNRDGDRQPWPGRGDGTGGSKPGDEWNSRRGDGNNGDAWNGWRGGSDSTPPPGSDDNREPGNNGSRPGYGSDPSPGNGSPPRGNEYPNWGRGNGSGEQPSYRDGRGDRGGQNNRGRISRNRRGRGGNSGHRRR